jgi:thioredoxin reductase (NADPH)
LAPLVFAGSPPGGQLMLTSELENFPGFTGLGSDLIQKLHDQAIKFGAKITDENVMKVDFSTRVLKVYLSESSKFLSQVNSSPPVGGSSDIHSRKNFDFSCISTKTILIATGAKAIWMGLESEKRLRGKGVSACATCDGFFFRNKTVAVIGGGDSALEEALTLTKFANKVYLIHRRDSFRASKVMQKRVFDNPKIEIIFNAAVDRVLGEKRVEGLKLRTSNVQHQTLKLDGIFVAIGHKPDTELFTNQIELDQRGYIVTTGRIALDNFQFEIENLKSNLNIKNASKIKNSPRFTSEEGLKLKIQKFDPKFASQTSVPGVFAAGDCVDTQFRQAATAAGMGVAAALEIEKYLENNH